MTATPAGTAQIKIPPKLIPVFAPRPGAYRFRGAYGGRGSGKTRTFAKMTAVFAYMFAMSGKRGVILCGREYMESLEESSLEEIKAAIREEPFLNAFFEIGEKFIRTRCRRVKYVFTGLRHNLDSIKGKSNVLLAWVDEAENVSDIAWKKLIPTCRAEGAEIWVTWNPEAEESPTDLRFRRRKSKRMRVVEMNYCDNPWFPAELEGDRLEDLATLTPEEYAWIWEGDYRRRSEAVIYSGKWIEQEFKAKDYWDGPYYGLDFGFANDPTAAVKCWVFDNVLYIEHDASKQQLELDETAEYLKRKIPGIADHVVRADNARPESISHLRRNGLPKITAVEKGPGSVEDGIAHIRKYRQIVVHPRCKDTKQEFKRYSYKTDRLSGDVLPVIVDKHNHVCDALRYALEPMIKRKGGGALDEYMAKAKKQDAEEKGGLRPLRGY